jgi:hypothetical protein
MASVAGAAVLPACSSGAGAYEKAARETWRHGAAGGLRGDRLSVLRELVRYATLAPSSHNTQCWRFRVEDAAITIEPDPTRRCPAVDPDDHHLFVSLGCAAENLIQAAQAHGMRGESTFDPARPEVPRVVLEPTRAVATPLFDAIPERQCTRGEYDGRPLSGAELRLLEQAGTGSGVQVTLVTDRLAIERILELVVEGNTRQMQDRAFVDELRRWIRFSGDEALRTGDGLYGACSGNPSVPSWLGNLVFGLAFRPGPENDRYAKQVRSSAGIAVFASEEESKARWVEVGRSSERFALQATALGVRTAFVNQPVEVAELRPQLARLMGIGGRRPDLVVRFGRGPRLPRSLRRPMDAVLA